MWIFHGLINKRIVHTKITIRWEKKKKKLSSLQEIWRNLALRLAKFLQIRSSTETNS